MTSRDPHSAARAVTEALQKSLGTQLIAVFLYGSLVQGHYQAEQSDVNLLALVADGTSIHTIRQAFQPVWWHYRAVLRRAPLIAQREAFARHLGLNPLFAYHLVRYGRQLYGKRLLPAKLGLDLREAVAGLVDQSATASQILTPRLLDKESEAACRQQLLRLARQLGLKLPPGPVQPVPLFAEVQRRLAQVVQKVPSTWQNQRQADAPEAISDLQAIYEHMEKLYFVLPDLNPQHILQTDWDAVAERIAGQCIGLKLTTAPQLQLLAERVYPLDHLMGSFGHEWGLDPLAQVTASPRLVMRDAARLPSNIELDLLPDTYLRADDGEIGKIIHDFQNRLLNIQLRQELLVRLKRASQATPPQSLPGRGELPARRIDAIFQQLHWWAGYYTNLMRNYDR